MCIRDRFKIVATVSSKEGPSVVTSKCISILVADKLALNNIEKNRTKKVNSFFMVFVLNSNQALQQSRHRSGILKNQNMGLVLCKKETCKL